MRKILSWRPALYYIVEFTVCLRHAARLCLKFFLKMSLERKMCQNDFDVSSFSDFVFPSTKEMELKKTMSF